MKNKPLIKASDLESVYQYFINQCRQLLYFIIPVIRNSIFLIFWIILQYFVQNTISYFELTNSYKTNIWLNSLRIIFGISTFIPILISLYRDSLVMWYRADREIKEEKMSKINSS